MQHRTHLEYLLYAAMLQMHPDVVQECRCQWQKRGYTGEPDRTTLVESLLSKYGPQRFLTYCEKFPSHAPISPKFFLLYNSASPGSLVKKVSFHAPLFHPTRRLEVVEEGNSYFIVEDVYFAGHPPVPADDMFVCSILKGVLREYGCCDIEVEWEAVRSIELYNILTSIGIQPLAIEKFTRWRYRWRRFERSYHIEGMDDFCLEKLNGTKENATDSLIFHLQRLLEEDLARRPPIEKLAAELNMSTRTLQRKLKSQGTSYAKLYNELRIKAAEKLLLTSSMTLSEISLFSGFNDNAHLCREFNKKHRLTPSRFRRQASQFMSK